METVSYELNGSPLTFCENTGALLSLYSPGCGEILQGGRGLIDLAWPVAYDYEILHAGVRDGGEGPQFQWDGEALTLRFDALGNSLGLSTFGPSKSLDPSRNMG